MIFHRNHLLPLNGNNMAVIKKGLVLIAFLLCSVSLFAGQGNTPPGKTFKVAMILPLHLDDYNGANVNRANIMLDYYQGFLLGLKQYEAQGFNVKLFVFDNKHDTAVTKELLLKPEMKDMDLIIAPILNEHLYIINHFSSKNQIAVLSPFTAADSLFPNNPLFFNAAPAERTKAELFYEYYRKTCPDKNLLIVKNDAKEEKGYSEKLIELLDTKPNINYRVINVSELADADSNFLVKWKDYLVYYTAETNKEIKAFNAFLDKQKATFEVFGDYKLATLKMVPKVKREKYGYKVISSDFINPMDSAEVMHDFKANYKTQFFLNPSRYSFIGHDQACFIAENLLKYDRFRATDFTGDSKSYYVVRFLFKKDKHCNQNKGLFILEFNEEEIPVEVKF